MLHTLGVVQACCGSPRLASSLCRKLGGRALLEWIARRVTESTRLSGVIVLARNTPDHQQLVKLVPRDIPVLIRPEPTALERLLRALEDCPAERVVRIRGDNPFVDPVLIDRLVNAAESGEQCEYAGYCSRDGKPAIRSPVGMFAEWFRTAAVRKLARLPLEQSQRDDITLAFVSHAEKFKLRLIPAPPELDREDVRLRLDSEEDYDNAEAIFEALGPERLDWRGITNLLHHQPHLRLRMAHLNRVCATQ